MAVSRPEITGSLFSRGDEFTVNNYIQSYQQYSQAIQLGDDGLLFVWSSYIGRTLSGNYEIRARLATVDDEGNLSYPDYEFTVNQNRVATQGAPEVIQLSDGRLLFTWPSEEAVRSGNHEIAARLGFIDEHGAISFGEEFIVNQDRTDNQMYPHATELPDGRVLIGWSSNGLTGDHDDKAISARVIGLDGLEFNEASSGDEFMVAQFLEGTQHFCTVTPLDDGRYLFLWQSEASSSGTDRDVIAVRIGELSQDGNIGFPGDEFTVYASQVKQWSPEVLQLDDGRLLFVWRTDDSSADGSGYAILARLGTLNDAGGIDFSAEFLVNERTAGYQNEPKIAQLEDGRVLFVWDSTSSPGDPSATGISARLANIDPSGTVEFESEFTVNPFTANGQISSEIILLDDARMLITWSSYGASPDDASYYGISARVISLGNLMETEEVLSTEGTLLLEDLDTSDVVNITDIELIVSGDDSGAPDHATLLAMLDPRTILVIDGTSTTGRIDWAFNGGTDSFDYLRTGDTLALTYSITVEDSRGAASTESLLITVSGTDDKPAIIGLDTEMTYTAGSGPLAIDGSITLADVDDTHIESAAIQITGNYNNGDDVLSIDAGDLLAGVSASWDATSGTLTLSADNSDTITKAQFETLLEKVRFETDASASSAPRTLSWSVSDGEISSDPATITVIIDNAFEVLTGTPAADTLTGTPEDEILLGLAGDDELDGGDGNDAIYGGRGDDELTGGDGADTFHFTSTDDGEDTLLDFVSGEDTIDLDALFNGLNIDQADRRVGYREVDSDGSNGVDALELTVGTDTNGNNQLDSGEVESGFKITLLDTLQGDISYIDIAGIDQNTDLIADAS
ncbi:MAG: hypothetical protein C3L25_13740 [Candidatus Sedimenticola endophacoides]|nr:MAG: hypothetical protein B0D86_05675 [Candidatus Sedimenticola endophacoides]PUD98043.1 MAG: hypothetical protein C3L26_13835 [Candidatus Sedimenticola endophacoides]PUE00429.1 MAG: hypothetical protein C3L25_13740 [Candidatus Sedimenticola endophacoides]